jgi:hypothetical protein
MDHHRVVIFGYPRCGSKLIAALLKQSGYHVHGEWYDTWTSRMEGSQLVRMTASDQRIRYLKNIENPGRQGYRHLLETTNRHSLCDISYRKYVITLWHENISLFPMMMMQYQDHFWLCPYRNNWDQLISRMLIWYNGNPDGETDSEMITIGHDVFSTQYWKLQQVTSMQGWLVKNGNGTWVGFEDAIHGRLPGVDTVLKVSTSDQHVDPESLISNLDEIRSLFNDLENEKKWMLSNMNTTP